MSKVEYFATRINPEVKEMVSKFSKEKGITVQKIVEEGVKEFIVRKESKNQVNINNYMRKLELLKQLRDVTKQQLEKCEDDGKYNLQKEYEIAETMVKFYELCFKDLFGGN